MSTVIARLYLSVVACGWAFIVFALHQRMGYEKASGYPPLLEGVGWASLLSGPLVLGAIFLTQRSLLARVTRLLAATALVVVLYLMLFVAWMWDIRMIIEHIVKGTLNLFFITFVLGPPILLVIAVAILVMPEVRELLRPNNRLQPTQDARG